MRFRRPFRGKILSFLRRVFWMSLGLYTVGVGAAYLIFWRQNPDLEWTDHLTSALTWPIPVVLFLVAAWHTALKKNG